MEGDIIDLNPYLGAAFFLLDILEWTGVIPDPISELISLFSGRPRSQATLQTIKALTTVKNPVCHTYGLGLYRLFKDFDIVLSSSDPQDQALLHIIREQFRINLQHQGITAAHAYAAQESFERSPTELDAQARSAGELTLDPADHAWGDRAFQSLYQEGLSRYDAAKTPHMTPDQFASRWSMVRARYRELKTVYWGQPGAGGTPPPWPFPYPEPTPSSGGSGGGGLPPPPSPPPPVPPLPGFNWAPLLDYVTSTFKPNLDEQLTGIATPLKTIGALVPIFQAIQQALPQILQALATGDLEAIATELKALLDCVCPHLEAIAKSVGVLAQQGDMPVEMIDLLIKQGVIDPEAGQLLTGSPVGHVLGFVFGGWERKVAHIILKDWPGGTQWLVNSIKPWAEQLGAYIKSIADDVVHNVNGAIGTHYQSLDQILTALLSTLSSYESSLPESLFNLVAKAITGGAPVTPDNVESVTFKMLGAAFVVGQGLHLLSAIAGWLGWPMSSVWGNNAQLAVQMLAYEEILNAYHHSFYTTAINARASQKHNKQFRPYVPQRAEAMNLYARGFLSDAERDELVALGGLDDKWAAVSQRGAYRPMSPFFLASAFVDQPIPKTKLLGAIRRAAADPEDVDLMMTAIENRSVQTLRNGIVNKTTTLVAQGMLSEADADNFVQGAFATTDIGQLLHTEELIGRIEYVATATIRAALAELRTSALTEGQARSLMEAANIQPWRIDIDVTLGEAQLQAALERKAEAAEMAQARRALVAAQNMAAAQYLSGTIDLEVLTAQFAAARLAFATELGTIGLDAALASREQQIAAIADAARIEQLKALLAGRQVILYGLTLTRQAAEVLRVKVDAIKEGVIRTDVLPETALLELMGLKVPGEIAKELVQRWKYQIYPKGALAPKT